MGFKAIKAAQQQQQFCDYVQNKIDVARDNNSTYELVDQDNRVQKLYSDPMLKSIDRIRAISRVKAVENGEECIVITKDVEFVDKTTGIKKDSYREREGLVELPLKITNEEGVTEDSQTRLKYTIPFSKNKVMEYVRKAGARGVEMRFYDGPETGNRVPNKTQKVGNLQYFLDATWEELLLGKEMGLVSSMINRLDEVRKNITKYEDNSPIVDTDASSTDITQQDTNKKEEQNNTIEQGKGDDNQKIPITENTKSGGTVKLRVSNTSNKKD